MVMMEKPSPIQVGREFVRQYYTLLNKAPELLYRFYSMHSSYVHGGRYCNGEPEKPVIGQNEIHQKIDSLKFCDCHTKIRQVDAHSTIGSGVVVQVTGELSNCGQPLRRFMQTFVLAPQGDNPYKFYVHNDIFRYQDEVFNDDVAVENSDEEQESEDELTTQPQAVTNQMPGYQDNYYNAPSNQGDAPQPTMTNGIEQRLEATSLTQHEPASPTQDNPPRQPTPSRTPTPEAKQEPIESSPPASKSPPKEAPKDPEPTPDEADVVVEPKAAPKAFSWADLASKNTPAARNNVQQGTVVRASRPQTEQAPAETTDASDAPPRQARAPRNNQRGFTRDEGFGDRGDGTRRSGGPGGGQGRDMLGTRYPDNQQIFVGNLPTDIAEADLKEHFADFGAVLEVKINHSHSSNPSFGFVIFEDPKAVEHVLEVMPTHYKKNNHRINIEEKKQRSSRDNNRRGGDMRRGGVGEGRGGRRAPPPMRRDRQGSREGPRPNYNNAPRR